MSSRGRSNRILLVSLLIYAFVILPYIQSAFILVFGLIAASVLKDQQEIGLSMFGFIARGVTAIYNRRGQSNNLREQVIKVCCSIEKYPGYVSSIIYRKKQLFFMLKKNQRDAAKDAYDRLLEVQILQDANYTFLKKIKEYAMLEFNVSKHEIMSAKAGGSLNSNGYEAVELLEHYVRDWSIDEPHIKSRADLSAPFIPWLKNKNKILVPGSGLGRLAVELMNDNNINAEVIDALELSTSMWLGSKYAISRLQETKTTVYPYLLQFSHLRNREDQIEGIPLQFGPIKKTPNFLYADFLKFDNGYKYDAIATLFFIDTAQNIFDYIDKISELLAPNGVWCNYGPLKYGTAAYVEFSVDELLKYLKLKGWKIVKTWDEGLNRYNGSEKSMLVSKYKLIGWAATKP